ncbi:hypothetical protein QQ045_029390 [Rhodiola kirilowii]
MRLARDMSEESDQVTKMAKFDAPVEEVRVSRTDPHTKAPWPDEDARGLSEVMPLPGLSKAPVHETVPMNEVRVPWDIRIYHGGTRGLREDEPGAQHSIPKMVKAASEISATDTRAEGARLQAHAHSARAL